MNVPIVLLSSLITKIYGFDEIILSLSRLLMKITSVILWRPFLILTDKRVFDTYLRAPSNFFLFCDLF